jgi:hypothetical protein
VYADRVPVREDLVARGRKLLVGDGPVRTGRARRVVFAVVLALVLLFALALLLQAVQDAPEEEVRTMTQEG